MTNKQLRARVAEAQGKRSDGGKCDKVVVKRDGEVRARIRAYYATYWIFAGWAEELRAMYEAEKSIF